MRIALLLGSLPDGTQPLGVPITGSAMKPITVSELNCYN
jgi:hypothetical protein